MRLLMSARLNEGCWREFKGNGLMEQLMRQLPQCQYSRLYASMT